MKFVSNFSSLASSFLPKFLFLGVLLALFSPSFVKSQTFQKQNDSIALNEVAVVASAKQTVALRRSPLTSSSVSLQDLSQGGNPPSVAALTAIVPNFFMPEYGTSLSSAIYIRGVGSRINTPAVALYIDDAPVSERSEFTMNLLGVDAIDVLKGPQGTLYGQSSMGGVIHLHTVNPFVKQGTEFRVGLRTRDAQSYLTAQTYQRFSEKWAASASLNMLHSDGFFRNTYLNKRADNRQMLGGNLKLLFHPNARWHFDWNMRYEYADEQGYPYYLDKVNSQLSEQMAAALQDWSEDRLAANRLSGYRRSLLGSNLKATLHLPQSILTSVSSVRLMNDRMLMDQDFSPLDYFTMTEKQKATTLSEELVWKNKFNRRWNWLLGAYTLWENMHTNTPVNFYADGVDMLNETLAQSLPTIKYTMMGQEVAMPLSLSFQDSEFCVGGRFSTPLWNSALFAQSTWHRFLLPEMSLTLGARLDYMHQHIRYNGYGSTINYRFSMQMITPADLQTMPQLTGKLRDNHLTLLPQLGLMYDLKKDQQSSPWGNVYLTVAKGQRPGGYNIQMFNDFMNNVLRQNMMSGTKVYCDEILQGLIDNAKSPVQQQMFTGIKQTVDQNIPTMEVGDLRQMVYKPESSWNYELGGHFNPWEGRLQLDASVFCMQVRNQQISRMVDSGLGRIMVNAGQSRSWGAELAASMPFWNSKAVGRVSYGYTNAKFERYDAGDADYTDNYVPFIPLHTLGARVDVHLTNHWTVGAQMHGLGKIYWTEDNAASQDFYATLSAHIAWSTKNLSVNLWGQNLTATQYKAFYFTSSNRNYYQKGIPFHLGIDVAYKLPAKSR